MPAYHANEFFALAFLHQRGIIAYNDIHTGLTIIHGITGIAPEFVHPLNGRCRPMNVSTAGQGIA